MFRIFNLVFMCVSLCVMGFSYGAATPLKSFDAASADLVGVKLGMNKDQVIQVLTKRFNVSKRNLEIYDEKDHYESYIQYSTKVNSYVSENIHVFFERHLTTKEMLVTAVYYDINLNDKQKVLNAAIKKYGEPTVSEEYNPKWCKNPQASSDSIPPDTEGSDVAYLEGMSSAGEGDRLDCYNQPTIMVSDTTISLFDPSPQEEKEKYLEQMQNVEPNI